MAIPDVLKSIADIEEIVIDLVGVIMSKDYAKILDMVKEVISLVKDMKAAFPEIKSMNAEDAKSLLQAIMNSVDAVIAAV